MEGLADECLKVAHLNKLAPIAVVLYKTVNLLQTALGVLGEHVLNLHIVEQFVLS